MAHNIKLNKHGKGNKYNNNITEVKIDRCQVKVTTRRIDRNRREFFLPLPFGINNAGVS